MTLLDKKIRACAEMDGFSLCPSADCDFRKVDHWHKNGMLYFDDFISTNMLPKYLTSYDAIIPVIQKQTVDIRTSVFKQVYYRLRFECYFEPSPSQLLDALLLAAGKYPDMKEGV